MNKMDIENELDVDDVDFMLLDMTANITKAMQKKINTVKNCFANKFLPVLRTINEKYTAHIFDDLPCDQIDKSLFGYFASYLMKSHSWKTAGSYLSGLRAAVCYKFRDNSQFTLFSGGNDTWYSGLRLDLLKQFSAQCKNSKTKLTSGSAKMKENDLKIMSKMLFTETESAHSAALNRCLLIFQWQSLGRM